MGHSAFGRSGLRPYVPFGPVGPLGNMPYGPSAQSAIRPICQSGFARPGLRPFGLFGLLAFGPIGPTPIGQSAIRPNAHMPGQQAGRSAYWAYWPLASLANSQLGIGPFGHLGNWPFGPPGLRPYCPSDLWPCCPVGCTAILAIGPIVQSGFARPGLRPFGLFGPSGQSVLRGFAHRAYWHLAFGQPALRAYANIALRARLSVGQMYLRPSAYAKGGRPPF